MAHYRIKVAKAFKRDRDLCKKRGYDTSLLDEAILILAKNGKLPSKYRQHKLVGNYAGYWECHIRPDWLMIWKQQDDELILTLTRTGTHADLF